MWILIAITAAAFQPRERTREQIVEEDIQAAIERLASDDYWEAARARQELLVLGRPVIPYLLKAFEAHRSGEDEKKIRVRFYVCELLGELRADDPESVKILIASLDDSALFGADRVATVAAASLGKLGVESAISPLVKKLDSRLAGRDRVFQATCIEALGHLRALEAEEALLRLVNTDERTSDEPFDQDTARMISCIAIEALGRIRSRKAVPAIVKRVDDHAVDPLTGDSIGRFVARALQQILPEQRGKKLEEVMEWARKEKERLEKEEEEKAHLEKRKTTRALIERVAAALQRFKADRGKYPGALEELKPEYVDAGTSFKDGWGNPIHYKVPGTNQQPFDLVSYGADNKPAGAGKNEDIWNHDAWKAIWKEKTVELLRMVGEAIRQFKKDQNRYPRDLKELVERPSDVKLWPKETYLPGRTAPLLDAFGAPLQYRVTGDADRPFVLKSLGLDHREGGEDIYADLSYWELDR